MKKICQHCNNEVEYEKYQTFGSHITNCNMNPKKFEINRKRIETKRKKHKIYKINCLNCNKEYELELTENRYLKGKYKKCCCKRCVNKYTQSFIDLDKMKISKCIDCNIEIEIKLKASEKNCRCDKCRSNILKIKNGRIKNKEIKVKNKIRKIICKTCGSEFCTDKKICKTWISGRSKLFIKFGFDISKLGSLDFYDEYNRIIQLLKDEYLNNSLVEIGEKYNINYQTIYMIFKNLGIKSRSLRDSNILAFKKGRYDLQDINIYPYKSGYHTSWDNKTFWLRSTYELEYCKKLDDQKIRYEVEKIRLQYFDTKDNVERTCVPDFYLIDTNEIVEIKSSWTYDEQNMKDKIKSYKESGYNFKLILDKKEIEIL